MPQKDIAGVVIVAFETEISVADWLVAKFSPTPIPTAVSPAITHMTACRIEASLPRANQNHRNFRAGDRERGCELGHTSLLKKNAPAQGPKALRFGSGNATQQVRLLSDCDGLGHVLVVGPLKQNIAAKQA